MNGVGRLVHGRFREFGKQDDIPPKTSIFAGMITQHNVQTFIMIISPIMVRNDSKGSTALLSCSASFMTNCDGAYHSCHSLLYVNSSI
jgi:hypothetical protein